MITAWLLAASLAAGDSLTTATADTLKGLYHELIEAEDRHDIEAVRRLVWRSPSMLFVAKTATPAQGNWAGFWGTDVVLHHMDALFQAGPFQINPDYSAERVVALSPDVAETYAPVKITVAYAGQAPVPKPFIMILDWVRTDHGWRLATDIALPIPQAPAATASPARDTTPRSR